MNRTSLAVPARTPLNQRLNSYRDHGYTKLLPGCALGSDALNRWSRERLALLAIVFTNHNPTKTADASEVTDLVEPFVTRDWFPVFFDGSHGATSSTMICAGDKQIITDAALVDVAVYETVKRFHVATRMGGNGLSVKLTDGGSRRIRAELAKAGEGATYTFDYDSYENCVILRQSELLPIADYVSRKEFCERVDSAARQQAQELLGRRTK